MNHKLNFSHIAASLVNDKWLLDSAIHANLRKMVAKCMSEPLPPTYGTEPEEFKMEGKVETQSDMLAIISINGILMKGVSPDEEDLLGLVNTDFVGCAIDDALADESVSAIVLHIASPGGSTVGIEELGRKILAADKVKPVYAWTEQCCNSAAYWLASQARIIGMTPSSNVGGVGVYTLIEDCSKAMEMEGVNIQAMASGEYKLMGHPFRPLTTEERALLQADVEKQHAKFKATILAKRNIDEANLEGLSYEGEDALKFNLTDVVVDSFNEFLTTTQTIDTKDMKSYRKQDKVAAAAPITKGEQIKEAVNAELTKVAAAVPGVPGTAEAPAGVAEDECKNIECPHCKKTFDPSEPHSEPDKDDEKKAEAPKDEPVEPKKEEAIVVAPVAEAPKVEVKAEAPVSKKAVMPSLSEWNSIMGHAPAKNPLYEASVEMIKNFSQLK